MCPTGADVSQAERSVVERTLVPSPTARAVARCVTWPTLRRVSRRLPSPLRRILVVVAIAGIGLGAAACGDDGGDRALEVEAVDPDVPADHDFLIPAGAGERIDAGEELDIFPPTLEAHVGETIRIVNQDDRGHLIGPFYVAADSTLTQRFASAGRFIGTCSVHPSGDFVLEVTP